MLEIRTEKLPYYRTCERATKHLNVKQQCSIMKYRLSSNKSNTYELNILNIEILKQGSFGKWSVLQIIYIKFEETFGLLMNQKMIVLLFHSHAF